MFSYVEYIFEKYISYRNLLLTILIRFAVLVCLLIGLGQQTVLAATFLGTGEISQAGMSTLSEHYDLESDIDLFLGSLPLSHYVISNIADLKSQMEDPRTVLIDVRELSEYQLGHIPGAINIPLRDLTQNLDKIPSDLPIVLYCSSGYRSGMGVMALHLLGYESVQGFPPSFARWQAAGEVITADSN